jgi:hypothetical protein
MLEKREAGSLGSRSEALTSLRKLKFIWLKVEGVVSMSSSEVQQPLEARRKSAKRKGARPRRNDSECVHCGSEIEHRTGQTEKRSGYSYQLAVKYKNSLSKWGRRIKSTNFNLSEQMTTM